MTREEAIYQLKNLAVLSSEREMPKITEAIDMAISALTEAENGCDGCLYEVSDGSLFPCNICRLNYGCQYEKDDSNYITESPNDVVEKNDEGIEPSDLISRADAIEAVENNSYGMGSRASVKAIKALPSAERVGEWIPLIHETEMTTNFPWERDGQWVIVTDGKTISVERIKKDAYDHFFPDGRWFEIEHTTAWMPLPQPYGAKMKGGAE